jgi:hypothetical protein
MASARVANEEVFHEAKALSAAVRAASISVSAASGNVWTTCPVQGLVVA